MRIFLTGASAHLAQALLPQLLALAEVEHIFGTDLKPALLEHPRYTHLQADIRDPQLAQPMQSCDVLIHMAFVVLRGQLGARRHDIDFIRSINIDAAQTLFQTASELAYRQAIYLSSASVYGGDPEQAIYFREDSPLNPLPDFIYAQHKTEMEHWLERFAANTSMPITRLRPHIIVGKHCQPLFRQLLQLPIYPRISPHRPLLQAVHETDVAKAICLAVTSNSQGVFNLAGDYCFNFQEQIKQGRPGALPLPMSILRPMAKLLWRLHGGLDDPAWLDGVDRFLLLDCERANNVLDWHPQGNIEQWLKRECACPTAPAN